MTADAPSTDPAPPAPPPDAPDPVVAAYTARMRRARGGYYGLILVVVAALVVVVCIAWSRGEVAHTTLKTVAVPPASVGIPAPTTSVEAAWTSTDHTAIGTPYWGGTVVTYDAHTVRGRNAVTGAPTWSYTRSDRSVCTAAQIGGLTISIFELHGNCDEVTALDSQTGQRAWTRTLDENGQPIFGHPSYQVTPDAFLIVTPTVVYALTTNKTGIDPGDDVFVFGQANCTIHSAVLGSSGLLVSQTCTNPDCGQLTFCHAGPQLLLRDGGNPTQSQAEQDANPDHILWNLAGNTDVPASADQVISAYVPASRALQIFDSQKGKLATTVPLDPAPATVTSLVSTQATDREFVWAGGVTYALSATAPGRILWTAQDTFTPTILSKDPANVDGTPDVNSAVMAAPTTAGVALLDPSSGVARSVTGVPVPRAGSLVYPLGPGFLVAGTSTAVYR